MRELNEVLDQEELLWYQKSRSLWIRDGDRNTSFYHKSTMIRRNRGRIRALKINNEWVSNPNSLSTHITDYFSVLFGRDHHVKGYENMEFNRPILRDS